MHNIYSSGKTSRRIPHDQPVLNPPIMIICENPDEYPQINNKKEVNVWM